jgi:hypothetical protein
MQGYSYTKAKMASFVIAVIYVDDAIFCGPHEALVEQLKGEFMKVWETRDLGDVTEFLRMKITRRGSKIHIDHVEPEVCARQRVNRLYRFERQPMPVSAE